MDKRIFWRLLLVVTAALVLLPGCAQDEEMTLNTEELEYEDVTIDELGLTLRVPQGWVRQEPDWEWSPTADSDFRVGVDWVDPAMVSQAFPAEEMGDVVFADAADVEEIDPTDLTWANGRVFRIETADGWFEHHTLVQLLVGENKIVDFYASAPTEDARDELEPVQDEMTQWSVVWFKPLIDAGDTSGWETYQNEEYGFRFSYPSDWVADVIPLEELDLPEEWPLEESIAVYPEAWRDDILQLGVRDADDAAVVEPLLAESLFGGVSDKQLVYAPPTEVNILGFNGDQVTVEAESVGADASRLRYVFFRSEDQDDVIGRWVVFVDQLTNFPQRVEGNEQVSSMVPQIVNTFEWTD